MNYNYVPSHVGWVGWSGYDPFLAYVSNKVRWARFEFLISALMNTMHAGMSRHSVFTTVSEGHSSYLCSVRQLL
jgi:hypothetical protein